MGFSAAAAIGLTAESIGTVGAIGAGLVGDAAIGAGIGAGTSAITGGDPAKGAEFGALTGFGGGAGGELGGLIGGAGSFASGIGGALGGIAGQELGSGGKSSLLDVAGAGVGGYFAGTNVPGGTPATGTAGGGASASAGQLPGGGPSGLAPTDLTTSAASGGIYPSGTVPAGSVAPNDLAGVITSPAAGGTGNFAPNPAFGTGVNSAGTFTPGASTMSDVTSFLGGGGSTGGAAPASNGLTKVLQGLGIGPETSQSINTFLNGTPATAGVGGAAGTAATGGYGKYLIPAAGLGFNALEQGKQTSAEKSLANEANTANAQGSLLQSYLLNGTLPPGAQAALSQATQAAKARLISQYAQRGQSTDPTQNSGLSQELAAIDTNAAATTFQLADQLFAQGVSGTQLSSQLYNSIIGNQRASNQDLSNSIAEFAAAASGGTRVGAKGVNINIPGATTG